MAAKAPQQKKAAPAADQKPATHVAIPVDKAQAILDYLGKQPFAEVANLVPTLTNALPVSVNQDEAK